MYTKQATAHKNCVKTVATAAPATPQWNASINATSNTMLSTVLINKNINGVKLSPIARSTEISKLYKNCANIPMKITKQYSYAALYTSGLVGVRLTQANIRGKISNDKTIKNNVIAPTSQICAAKERRVPCSSCAPILLESITLKPDVQPKANCMKINTILDVSLTPATSSADSV